MGIHLHICIKLEVFSIKHVNRNTLHILQSILHVIDIYNLTNIDIYVTVCTWGGYFYPGERDKQSFHFGILLRVMTSAQMASHMCRLSHPKQIMTSLGHHMVML